MKKIILIICIFIHSMNVNAQFYMGGSFGIGLVSQRSNESITFKILPEVGYNINEKWAIGFSLGYKKGSCLVGQGRYNQNVTSKAVGFQPYIRYKYFHVGIVDLFVDGCITYECIIDEGVNLNIGVCPGILLRPINKLTIVSHLGFGGAEVYIPKGGGSKCGVAGLNLDTGNLTIGLNYEF